MKKFLTRRNLLQSAGIAAAGGSPVTARDVAALNAAERRVAAMKIRHPWPWSSATGKAHAGSQNHKPQFFPEIHTIFRHAIR